MNVLERKAEVIILLPASYETEWQGNVVMLCGELRIGKSRVRGLQRKSALEFMLSQMRICLR